MVYQPVEAQLNNPKMNSRLFSTLLRIVRQRVFEHSRMIKSYRVLRRLRNVVTIMPFGIFKTVLTLLGVVWSTIIATLIELKLFKWFLFFLTHFERRMSNFLVRISIVFLLVSVVLMMYYLICLILGSMDLFQAVFLKLGLALGARALSFALLKLGLAGGLALAIGCALRALFCAEEMPLWMLPSGADAGSEASVNQEPEGDEAGPSNVAPAESPLGSFPSVPSSLTPIPSSPSVPSLPSLPHLEDNSLVGREQPVQQPQEVPVDWSQYQHDRITERLSVLTPTRARDADTVDAIILLKQEIIHRMAQLDPHPFWAEQKEKLVANGILNNGSEYTIETLQKNVIKLTTEENFKKLKKTRENFELNGRFD